MARNHKTKFSRVQIGITRGDPAGIGPEILEAALNSGRLNPNADYLAVGPKTLVAPGRPTYESGQAALESLELSCDLLKQGKIDAVVTSPVSKQALHLAGFQFPGQTEFFAARLGCTPPAIPSQTPPQGTQQQDFGYAMCLTGRRLTVALATIHIPLQQVAATLSPEEIFRVGCLLADFCQTRLSRAPRIAVCGLNPHAGESGAFGDEETKVIAPAINRLNRVFGDLADFTGPHVPDAIFRRAVDGHYDAVLAMYHDQGLIPFKLTDFDTGVNTTLGLKFPRTSPDHGTAYDIAGQGIAKPTSLIAAINLATELLLPGTPA